MMDEKEDIRKGMMAKRGTLSEDGIAEASGKVMRNLFMQQEFLKAGSVGFYYPTEGEIDTREMIERALALGKKVYIPKTGKTGIVFYEYDGEEKLVEGKMGMMEPSGSEAGEPEVLVVPGLAFDMGKRRLGFGKGYYDAYIGKNKPFTIGVCFEWQIVPKLPQEKHDALMDVVIAEEWAIE